MPKLSGLPLAFGSKNTPITVWDYKPWWCQPWSIILTGMGAIALSWIVFHPWWLSLLISLPLCLWMAYFLILWPKLIAQSGILPLESPRNQPGR